jgi:hypothetical protein
LDADGQFCESVCTEIERTDLRVLKSCNIACGDNATQIADTLKATKQQQQSTKGYLKTVF